MGSAAHDAGLAVRDRIVVRDGRWSSLHCDDPSCCPAGGRPLPQPHEVPAVAEFVGREISPHGRPGGARGPVATGGPAGRGRRRGLRRRLAGGTAGRLRGHRRGLPGRAPARAADLGHRAELPRRRRAVAALTPPELARLAVSLTDVDIRDALVAWICPGALTLDLVPETLREQMVEVLPAPLRHDAGPGLDPAEHAARRSVWSAGWSRCAPRFPRPGRAAPLTVLASFTWWRGDGALTRIALDRALAVDPDYRLARLLERMVDLAIRPFGCRRERRPIGGRTGRHARGRFTLLGRS